MLRRFPCLLILLQHPLCYANEDAGNLLLGVCQTDAGELARYSVSHASGLIRCGTSVQIGDMTTSDAAADQDNVNQIKLDVQPIGVGLYPDRLTLTSQHDVRIIDVEIDARKLGHSFTLNLDSAPNHTLTQDVPVTNNTGSAMNVTATVRKLPYASQLCAASATSFCLLQACKHRTGMA